MDKPTRRDIRLHGYDYSRNGAYFVTVCTKDKMCIFWENEQKYRPLTECADNERLIESQITKIVSNPPFQKNIHQSQSPPVGAAFRRPRSSSKIHLSEYGKIVKNEILKIHLIYPDIVSVPIFVVMPNHIHMIIVIDDIEQVSGRRNAAPTVSRIMNQFKGSISKQIGFPPWQKSFYDRIIRNQHEYDAFWRYIENNPINWENDELFSKE